VNPSTELPQLAVAVPDPPVGRPPRGWWRLFIAYTTTVRVVMSYLSLRVQMRFRSPAVIDELLRKKNLINSRRIHKTISRLQGLFIKVGQLISIMTNFLPPEFRAELEGLQDQVPPRPYSDVEKRVIEELGRSPRELFAEFDERPVASASIGQVHRAKLPSGEAVAVKVQYPDIEEIVRLDLRALRWIFDVVSYFVPYRGLDGVYREIRAMILQELDFRGEADNVARIAARFGGRTDVGFPRVVKELSTGRILTTEWIDAVKVSDRVRLQSLGVDRSRLARRVVAAYCQQIFTDGVYHADPHPGNLLVRQNAAGDFQVVFIDFGAVAEVSPRMRRGIADLIQAALARDTPKLVQAMKDMGFIARGADPAIFDKVIDFLHQKFQEEIQLESFSLKDVKFDPEKSLENLADLRRMDVSIRDLADHFHVPKEWILLERTVLLLMGLCTELDPALNPMDVIRPYLEEFVLGKDRDWSGLFVNTTKDIASSVLALPSEVKKFLMRAQRGELEVRFRGIDEHARLVYALGHQLIWAALGITAGAFGMVFDGRSNAHAARLCFYGAGAFGLFLFASMVSWRFRLKRRRR
jgi:predicted unusual protein kinase regulating ubiquinone biosynthesis (AarF/ABC1/UbiB family)